MKDKAKKSNDGKDAAAAKGSAKNTKKLRKTVDSAQDRIIREEIGFRIIEDKWGTGGWIRKPVEKWECNDTKAWRKLSQKAKIHDTKVVLSLRLTESNHENAAWAQIQMYSTTWNRARESLNEGDKRLMIWLYWRENPYAHAALCARQEDDDDVWEDYVGMVEVDTIEDLEPESWEDGTPKMPCVPRTHVHRKSFCDFTTRWFLGGNAFKP